MVLYHERNSFWYLTIDLKFAKLTPQMKTKVRDVHRVGYLTTKTQNCQGNDSKN